MKLQTNHLPGLVITEHLFELPLDYSKPNGAKIKVFGREVVAPSKVDVKLPWLVFLQGGPGFGSPRPMERSGWLNAALNNYRVFLLDQRGTTDCGTKVHAQTLSHMTPAEQAEYLSHFRADNIVRDAEMIRHELVRDKWTALGQSFGGFCINTYLSIAPEGLKEAIITGGVPSLVRHVDDVYRETCKFIMEKNEIYYQRYPQDVEKVKKIVKYLEENKVYLPCGDLLSARRFLTIGLQFGYQSGYETVHYIVENAFNETANGTEISYTFKKGMEQIFPFDTNPIFAILHEAIYAQGFATNWSAERMLALYPEFGYEREKILFLGEMVFPWMFDECVQLKPLKAAAEILAQKEDWSRVYYPEVLKNNKVPVACAVYYNDMFVNKKYSQETIDFIPNMVGWYTSEFEHCGLRVGGERLFNRLMGMIHGEVY